MEVLLILLATLQATSSLSSDREVSGLEGGSVSVPCHYDLKYRDHVKYWCRGKSWELCEAVKRTDDPKRDEDKVSISDDQTRGVFTVTMRRLEKTDKGWYWCAIKLIGNQTDEHAYIYLKVAQGTSSLAVASYTITGLEGGSVSVLCHYDECCWDHVKYWCTGKEWDSCKTVKRSDSPQNAADKTSITDNKTQGVFSVTMRRLEKGDAGWYWCAIEREGLDDRISLFLTVADTSGVGFVVFCSVLADASSLSTERAFTGLVGGSVSVPCHYDMKYRDHVKYWCKGYQWTYCDILKQTDSPYRDSDKISISDDRTGGVFIVTMRRLDKEDTDWYWCAIKLGGTKEADQHFYLYLTVTEGKTLF
ncbi:hypothetical protein HHUSO_G4937 [Huso huso]|uniref:Immunoglobulin domain-containing protein n=1 Tax=Huso huso TaxID=61971 RepID=A0ABR1A0F3_HUSHU